MYYTLSEQEYTELIRYSHQLEVVEAELATAKLTNERLQANYNELRTKYNNLLVLGVTIANERLKR